MAVALGQPGELPGALSIDQQGGVVDPAGSNATLGLGGNVTGVPVYNASLIVPNITAGGWVGERVGGFGDLQLYVHCCVGGTIC